MTAPRVRLGIGATVPEGANFFAQRRFLEAIQRRVPAALRTLADVARLPEGAKQPSMIGRLDRETEAALGTWAERWGIPYPNGWWMRQIRGHVRAWREAPSLAGRWRGFQVAYREPAWPVLAPWNANEETELDFDARVESYKRRVKALPGVVPAPVTYREIDFDALVLEHVAQMSIEDVASELQIPGDASTIRKRNAQLAELLSLPLRRRGRGRPAMKSGKAKSR